MADADVNKVILIGRVVREPVIKPTRAGVPQAFFVLSTQERWFDKPSNTKRERTTLFRVIVYGDSLIRVVEKCVHRGARLYIEGGVSIRTWVGKDGQSTESLTCEIVVQGWSGRLTVLDFADELARPEPADVEDDLGDSPVPLSIKRSLAKFGDGLDADDSPLPRSRFPTTIAADEDDRRRG